MPPPTLLLFLLLVSLSTPFVRSGFEGSECLKVSPSDFIGSVRKVSDVLEDVTIILMSNFTNFNSNPFDDARLSDAISSCLNLLDLSLDELSWSISAVQSPQGNHNGTGIMSSDLGTWLSATLANIDTCMDGFEGTSGENVKALIFNRIDQVNSLVQKLLTQVQLGSDHCMSRAQFPSWVEPEDQRLLQTNGVLADAVVAIDGTGNYTRVMDAVQAAPEYSMKRYVIYIKKGVYNENVEIGKKKWNLVVIGDGMDSTIITGNLSNYKNFTTFKSATFAANGRRFIARDISFRNTAGPEEHQAVALRSNSDLSVFYRCEVFGYQDSLYVHSLRQFYRECKISGTVDFIFGHGTAVFQNCQILVKKGLEKQKNTITAQGEKDPTRISGFTIQFCNISADYDLLPFVNSTSSYLGRPWKAYSRTIFMQSYISDIVSPQGWLEWNGSLYLDTLYYAEYKNYGPGAGLNNRVKWPGYHVINDSKQASNFTADQFIYGYLWIPSTGVVYTPGFGD